jgi:hypothetical protein
MMTEGNPADGAPARVDPLDFANATRQLFAAWERLLQLGGQHSQTRLRICLDYDSFTARDVHVAWEKAGAEVGWAVMQLAYVIQIILEQRDAIVAALEQAAASRETNGE